MAPRMLKKISIMIFFPHMSHTPPLPSNNRIRIPTRCTAIQLYPSNFQYFHNTKLQSKQKKNLKLFIMWANLWRSWQISFLNAHTLLANCLIQINFLFFLNSQKHESIQEGHFYEMQFHLTEAFLFERRFYSIFTTIEDTNY